MSKKEIFIVVCKKYSKEENYKCVCKKYFYNENDLKDALINRLNFLIKWEFCRGKDDGFLDRRKKEAKKLIKFIKKNKDIDQCISKFEDEEDGFLDVGKSWYDLEEFDGKWLTVFRVKQQE